MKTVTFSVADREAVKRRTLEALSGKRRGAHISFASADLLWKVLTAKIEFPFDAVHVDFMLKAVGPAAAASSQARAADAARTS